MIETIKQKTKNEIDNKIKLFTRRLTSYARSIDNLKLSLNALNNAKIALKSIDNFDEILQLFQNVIANDFVEKRDVEIDDI